MMKPNIPPDMTDCAFCSDQNIRGREIVRDDLVFAFPTNIPIVPGHTLICPVRHVETFAQLSAHERDAIFSLAENVKKVLAGLYGSEGFHEVWNEGAVAGQSIPHFHLHIVPRKRGDTGITEYEPRQFLYRPGSREVSPDEELRSVAQEIRMRLSV